MVFVYGVHSPWGHCIICLGAVVVGDVYLLVKLVGVFHDQGVRYYGVDNTPKGVKRVLSWVEFGGNGIVNARG